MCIFVVIQKKKKSRVIFVYFIIVAIPGRVAILGKQRINSKSGKFSV